MAQSSPTDFEISSFIKPDNGAIINVYCLINGDTVDGTVTFTIRWDYNQLWLPKNHHISITNLILWTNHKPVDPFDVKIQIAQFIPQNYTEMKIPLNDLTNLCKGSTLSNVQNLPIYLGKSVRSDDTNKSSFIRIIYPDDLVQQYEMDLYLSTKPTK